MESLGEFERFHTTCNESTSPEIISPSALGILKCK